MRMGRRFCSKELRTCSQAEPSTKCVACCETSIHAYQGSAQPTPRHGAGGVISKKFNSRKESFIMTTNERFLYLVAGTGIGAIIGILFAPKAGHELRDNLA